MRWFRIRRRDEQQAPPTAAAQPAPVPEPAPDAVAASATPAEAGVAAPERPKRRRGSRGGRNRRKKPAEPAGAAATAASEPEAAPAPKPQAKPKADRPERKGARRERSSSRRRREPARRALPPAKRELLVSVDVGEQRVAVLEDDGVAEVYLERPERRSIAGNIYLGAVDNVLPGMEAAFVEIGLEKNGFLYVDEIVVPELEGKRHGKKIQDLLSKGQEILVQAVKDPMKTKGARLTTEISLPGRFVVFVPNGEGTGVSRRLDDEERARLKEILRGIDLPEGGLIVRTAAEGASAEDIERDVVFLQRLWRSIQARAKAAKPPTLVYQEAELPLRVTRDLFTGDFERALVDDDQTYKRIVGYLKKTSPHMVERVVRYKEKAPLMDAYGVDAAIRSTLSRRVDLPSGGYLVFDYAEAFTVIDVNTGRFVGSRSRSSGARLEDTITKNNLEAVKEVVRQLRLRDVGGIIVIDFIDMANPKNRATVEEALRTELERDRTKTYVVEISPLGLVEMTRQNVTDGPREILTRKCPTCGGDGIVVSHQTAAIDLERRLRALAAGSRSQAYRVEVPAHAASVLIGPGAERLVELEARTKRRFFLVPREGVPVDHFVVLAEGKLADLAPESPVEEGAQVELKLVEVGRHDPDAGVGKRDGLDVAVAHAGRLVGKKVKARVERVLDGTAYATLLSPKRAEAEPPITAEREAEKPTRKPPARKAKPAPAAEPAPPEATGEPEAAAPEPAAEEPAEEAAAEELAADGTPAKKRTRRGSRGGRRRRKTAAAENGAPEEEEAAAAPRIHVPDADLGGPEAEEPAAEAEEPAAGEEPEAAAVAGQPPSENGDGTAAPRKRTRRGTRGGRNRRKRAADGAEPAAEGEPAAEPVAEGEVAAEPVAEDGEAPARDDSGYVPMSEWIDDLVRGE